MKLSIIIPCFNEKNTIKTLIDAVIKAPITLSPQSSVSGYPHSKEIIIIDDFSTDGTRQILKELESEDEREGLSDLKILYHSRNQGKGAAIRTGIKTATGDIVIIQDADMEYDPNEYSKLIEPIIKNKADVVFGSRFLGIGPHRVLYLWHRVGNGFLTLLSNIFTNLNLTDMETCYKAFRREIIQSIKIEENRFGIEPEITAKVSKRGCRIYEVGISYYGRTYADGKKINWKDGIWAIYCIVKYNLFR